MAKTAKRIKSRRQNNIYSRTQATTVSASPQIVNKIQTVSQAYDASKYLKRDLIGTFITVLIVTAVLIIAYILIR
jgi:hypothetical protein